MFHERQNDRVHTSRAAQRPRCLFDAKQRRHLACVLTVHFKGVTNLVKHQIVRAALLQRVIIIHIRNGKSFNVAIFRLRFCRLNLFLVAERAETVRAVFRFVRVNRPFRFTVDGWQGHDGKFAALLRYSGNRHIVLVTKPLHILVQVVRRDAAHGNAAHIRDVARGQRQVKHRRGAFGVLAEHLIEIADAIKHQIVRVFQLDRRIVPNRRVLMLLCYLWFGYLRFCGSCLRLCLPLRLFRSLLSFPHPDGIRQCPVLPVRNQLVDALYDLCPGKLHFSAVRLFQPDALALMVHPTVKIVRNGAVMPADSVFMFEIIGFFFIRVVCIPEKINAASQPVVRIRKNVIDLVLRDEVSDSGRFRHVGVIFAARQLQFVQASQQFHRTIDAKAQDSRVFLPRLYKLPEPFRKGFSHFWIFQHFSNILRHFGETAAADTHTVIKRTPALFAPFLTYITDCIENSVRKLTAFKAGSLGKLHIGRKLSLLQQLADPRRRILP